MTLFLIGYTAQEVPSGVSALFKMMMNGLQLTDCIVAYSGCPCTVTDVDFVMRLVLCEQISMQQQPKKHKYTSC